MQTIEEKKCFYLLVYLGMIQKKFMSYVKAFCHKLF